MRTALISRRGVAFVLLSIGLGLGGSAVSAKTQAAAATGPTSIFDASGLVAGDSLTGYLDVPSGNLPLVPYLLAIDLRDGCLSAAPCPPGEPKLSQTLQLVVTAPDGATWQGTPTDLTTTTALPGDQLAANSGSWRYRISLLVPATLTNSSQDRTIAFALQYGAVSSAESLGTPGVDEPFKNGTLPFTGSYAGIELWAGAALCGCGGVLLLISRIRRHADT